MDQQPAPTSPSPAQPQTTGSGSKTGLIIAIVVIVLIVLGVGGYLLSRYLINKAAKTVENATTGNSTSTDTSKTTGTISVTPIVESLKYPGATITDQKQGEENSIYAAELTESSSDSVATIKDYYVKLASTKNWKITRQGSSGDNNYYLTITSDDFTAEIDTTKYEGYDTTDIIIRISGENLKSEGI